MISTSFLNKIMCFLGLFSEDQTFISTESMFSIATIAGKVTGNANIWFESKAYGSNKTILSIQVTVVQNAMVFAPHD